MKSVVGLLLSRWVLSFVGIALLGALVWLFGPLVPPLETGTARLAIILALLLVWLAANLLIDRQRRRRETALAAGVAEEPDDPSASRKAEEAAALRARLTGALTLLRRARGTRGYLYEQPWYVIIGPPGAGKSTALVNAGLNFPLAAEMGQGAVAGIGGTRLCDWWFADEAVLIDTAGRYTTQDSDAQVDRAGWEAFLDLLRRTRKRQPLNGVLVAIAVADAARGDEAERTAHARTIRQRVRELEGRLGVRMPVYLLFTKADLLAGFSEFFADLDRDRRAQVWGTTFPLGAGEANPGAAFEAEFRQLVERLNGQLLDRLQEERGADRRASIAAFPAQVASLAQPLADFIQSAFGGSSLDRAPLLRGVYFTSGTQHGTPIDRLTSSLARTFGLDQQRLPSLRPERGRSYFLGKLLREVVLGEAMLVSERPGAARRRTLLRAGAFAAIALAVGLTAALLWRARLDGARQIADTGQALDAYEQAARGLPLDPVGDADLPRLVPLLDRARALQPGAGQPDQSAGPALGLSQDAKLATAAREVYRHALDYALLPRLIWRLEAEMRGRFNQPDFLYEATRIYLMLGNGGPLDRSLVHDWMALDWQASYPGPLNAPLRESLLRHLDALLAEPLPQLTLDGELVAGARSTFSRVSLAQRVYPRIRLSAAAQALPPWRPRDALGPAGIGVFVRLSGKSMDEGIPGFFTVDGFHKVLLPSLADTTKAVASESWVLGKRAEIDPTGPQIAAIERDVIGLYETDYIRAWDAMINDLDVVPLRSASQAAQDLYIIASPQSPLRDLLASIARQVTLSAPPADANAGASATGANKPASGEADRFAALFGTQQPGQAAPSKPGHAVDEHFRALRDFVGNGPGAPLDLLLKSLNDLQQEMAKIAASPLGASTPPPGGNDPALALRAEAQRQPPPLSRWLADMAAGGTALRGGNARQQVVLAYNGAGGPASFCAPVVGGRYPFVPGSATDVPLDDFTRLFAPGGLLDGFFNTQLRPFVVTTGKTWQLQPVDGTSAPLSPADLAQFQRAAAIRDMFFPGGGTAPLVRFDMIPVGLDSNAKTATLDFDGTQVTATHDPPRAVQITWPGPNRMQNVRLSFDPPASANAALAETGPWAMFRLLGHGQLQRTGAPDRFRLTFRQGEREAVFEVRADSIVNPFAPGPLQDFRCPVVQ
ncbi:MAG: type VI secretion system membrane subunit TssM [Acetobacteraceae bacterium]|nr:type VI secretion system membrane subunit TssM [Acetobacteraceae bacterium]